MKELNAYLLFNGNCREAMTFYQKCLGGDLQLSTFADMPGNIPPEAKDQIAHARIVKGGSPILMASDNIGGPPLSTATTFLLQSGVKALRRQINCLPHSVEKAKSRCRRRKPPGQSGLPCSLTSSASTGC